MASYLSKLQGGSGGGLTELMGGMEDLSYSRKLDYVSALNNMQRRRQASC